MECSEAREQILSASIDDDVREHLAECDSCHALAEEEGRLARALGEPPVAEADDEGFEELFATIENDDGSLRSRLHGLPTRQRMALLFVAAVGAGVLVFAVARRPDWSGYPMGRMILVAICMIAATAVGVLLALPRYFRPRKSLVVRGLGVLFLLAVAFLPALLPEPQITHPAAYPDVPFWKAIAKCTGLGVGASLPVIALAWGLKRSDRLEWWSTLSVALVAAVGANLALQVHCPVVDPMHILLSHSGLAFLYAAAAWILVKLSR